MAAVACALVGTQLAPGAAAATAAATRPQVAVVAENDGTEITDFLVPFAVLSASGVADVTAVSIRAGPVSLLPAGVLEDLTTVTAFDTAHPAGADYVVVPAVHRSDDATLIAWVRAQAARGATIVGVCDGAWVLARAGVLAGRSATGHWYSRERLARQFPETDWVAGRRFVEDGAVVTTTGVTASIPVSLRLVERIGGRARAEAVARDLGSAGWDPAHDSAAFTLGARHVIVAARNWIARWRHERIGIPVRDGVDDVALALTVDAFGRTYRSTPILVSASEASVVTRHGLRLRVSPGGTTAIDRMEAPPAAGESARALDRALSVIEHAYGVATADFVALQLEYPRGGE